MRLNDILKLSLNNLLRSKLCVILSHIILILLSVFILFTLALSISIKTNFTSIANNYLNDKNEISINVRNVNNKDNINELLDNISNDVEIYGISYDVNGYCTYFNTFLKSKYKDYTNKNYIILNNSYHNNYAVGEMFNVKDNNYIIIGFEDILYEYLLDIRYVNSNYNISNIKLFIKDNINPYEELNNNYNLLKKYFNDNISSNLYDNILIEELKLNIILTIVIALSIIGTVLVLYSMKNFLNIIIFDSKNQIGLMKSYGLKNNDLLKILVIEIIMIILTSIIISSIIYYSIHSLLNGSIIYINSIILDKSYKDYYDVINSNNLLIYILPVIYLLFVFIIVVIYMIKPVKKFINEEPLYLLGGDLVE